jgi:hypothetical protein
MSSWGSHSSFGFSFAIQLVLLVSSQKLPLPSLLLSSLFTLSFYSPSFEKPSCSNGLRASGGWQPLRLIRLPNLEPLWILRVESYIYGSFLPSYLESYRIVATVLSNSLDPTRHRPLQQRRYQKKN